MGRGARRLRFSSRNESIKLRAWIVVIRIRHRTHPCYFVSSSHLNNVVYSYTGLSRPRVRTERDNPVEVHGGIVSGSCFVAALSPKSGLTNLSSKFDRFLAGHRVNFYAHNMPACCQSASFGPLFAFYCPLFFTGGNN